MLAYVIGGSYLHSDSEIYTVFVMCSYAAVSRLGNPWTFMQRKDYWVAVGSKVMIWLMDGK